MVGAEALVPGTSESSSCVPVNPLSSLFFFYSSKHLLVFAGVDQDGSSCMAAYVCVCMCLRVCVCVCLNAHERERDTTFLRLKLDSSFK